jgi:hypothetical protein
LAHSFKLHKMNAIIRTPGDYGREIHLHAHEGSNAEILKPLADAVVQLERNRCNFNLSVAIAERAIMTELVFGTCPLTTKLMIRKVTIDMAPGRQTHLVFDGPDNAKISIQFTEQCKAAWLTPEPQAVTAG